MHSVETERLVLRAPEQRDAEAMLAIRNSAFVREFNPMRVWEIDRMRAEIEAQRESGGALYIERKADGALLGGIWFEEDDQRYCVASKCVSYYLGESYTRQGYMREALGAAVEAAFAQDEALEVVAARVFRGNTASERLLLGLGFTYEGCLLHCVRSEDGRVFDDMQFCLLRADCKR